MNAAAKVGAAVRIEPLDIVDGTDGNRRAGTSAGLDLSQLRQQLAAALSQHGGTHTQQTPALYACLEVGAPRPPLSLSLPLSRAHARSTEWGIPLHSHTPCLQKQRRLFDSLMCHDAAICAQPRDPQPDRV